MRNRFYLNHHPSSDWQRSRSYVFLADGEVEEERLSHAALDRRARGIAAALAAEVPAGERALLLYPPGLDFIAAFLGCLYAGVVAVPASPPRPRRDDARLRSIVEDSLPRVVLTTSKSLATYQRLSWLAELSWLATDGLPEEDWEGISPLLESPAFLQYTSGSTGTPKGVIVSHANLLHNEQLIQNAFGQDESSVVVGWLPFYHDMGLIGNVLQPLFSGAGCVLMSPMAFLQRPRRWLEAISRYRGTTSGGPNFAYDLCVDRIDEAAREGLDLASWAVAFNGSEPVRAATLERFATAFAPCGFRREALFPCYGLAEATLFVAGPCRGEGHRVANAEGSGARPPVSCGEIWGGQEVAIVAPETLEEAGPGEVGEIWISGPSVAMGYWNRPAATTATFQARLARRGGRGFLRTGDLGFLKGGQLFVTGRLKDLIIVRGRNHYPQDLELTVKGSHPALGAGLGAAFAVDWEGGEAVALVQEADLRRSADWGAALEAARVAVAEEHGVALQALLLVKPGAVPRTTSGKVQRHLCRRLYLEGGFAPLAAWQPGVIQEQPEPTALPDAADVPAIAAWLRGLLARRLGVAADRLDPRQPLLRQGLDSLAAVELGHDVEVEMGIELPSGVLLEGPSLDELAAQLHELAGSVAAAPFPARVEAGKDETALSSGQRALWFLHEIFPAGAAYNLAGAARLYGEVDAAALRGAFQELVRRHDALRTTFPLQGDEPVRLVAMDGRVDFAEVDAAAWSAEELAARLVEEAHRPFDLAQGPLLRVSLFRSREGAPVLLVVIHHIVTDFWSLGLLARELGLLYDRLSQGDGLPLLPRPATRYGDFVRWQRLLLASGEGERSEEYWRGQLAGELPVLELPADRPRPRQQSFRGAACSRRLDPFQALALRALAHDGSATLFTALVAGFQALLHRYTGQSDLTVGSPAAGRPAGELAGIAGYLVNPVVLRSRYDGVAGFVGFLSQARTTVLGALAHQAYPFPLLAERLQPERDPSRSPLFQAMFVYHRSAPGSPDSQAIAALALGEPGERLDLGSLALEPVRLETRASQLDVTLRVAETGDGLAVQIVYDTALFDACSAERMLGHYAALLGEAVAAPARSLRELPLLAPAERHQVTVEWNATAREVPRAACVHELFAAQAARTPHAMAVEAGEERLTYEELHRRAGALARTLRGLGVGADTPVGIFQERSADLVVSVLAVLEAGGVFVPLDSLYPIQRLRQICRDSGMRWLLGDGAAAELVREIGAEAPRLVPAAGTGGAAGQETAGPQAGGGLSARPESLAYLLYTSGSTGQPKGVGVSHRALVNLLSGLAPQLGVTDRDTVASFTTLCFDIGIFEVLLPLVTGGRLVVLPSELAAYGRRLASRLEACGPTVVQATPATWSLLVDAGWQGHPGLRALCGGEALSQSLAAALRARSGRAWNMYGPTEAAVYACIHELSAAAAPPPIGRPVANTRLYVREAGDGAPQPVPLGVAGELYIAGEGLARGYWGRPDFTAERFLPDPFSPEPGGRAYRTGDLARRRRDGEIEYLGRIDSQVKIRGFRVELNEIRAHLSQHPEVGDAVVICHGQEPRLIAYVVASEGSQPTAGALRSFLAERLPVYMVPATYVSLPALPLTLNGKLDRRALPPPPALRPDLEEGFVAPRTPVEEVLAGMWAGLLEIDRVGVRDNFFQLGGHSLRAAQVMARVRDLFQVELPLLALFHGPTVEALAREIEAVRRDAAPPPGPVIPAIPVLSAGGETPASLAQARIWFLDRLQPGTAVYNMPLAVELAGALDVPALAGALEAIVRRHAVLRAAFPEREGQPVQALLPAVPRALSLADLSALPASLRAAEAQRLEEREARRPFDLERGPVFRAALLRLDRAAHVLLVNVHHIAADGASLSLFLRELGELYAAAVRGRPAALPALSLQYTGYAAWQRGREVPAADLAWWRERLAPVPPLELPADRPRPPVHSFRGGAARLALGHLPALSSEGRRQGLTPFVVLFSAFTALLQRYTGGRRIPAGAPVDVRDRLELEPVIGMFVNLLVLAPPVEEGLRGAELLGRVRDELLAAYEHRHLPFELLVEELRPRRSLSHNPLVQVTVAFEPPPVRSALPGLELAARRLDTGTAKFDLSLTAGESPEGWTAHLEYSADLFDATTANRLLGHLGQVLRSLLAAPDLPLAALSLLSAAESHQALVEWNDTALAAEADAETGANVCDLFEMQARRAPEAPALLVGERVWSVWSYGELNRWANRVAHSLRALGVGPEVPVAVCMPRSAEMIAASLAVLKAGGAYLPLDPAHPMERLRGTVADAGAPVVLTLEPWLSGFAGGAAMAVCLDALGGDPPEHDPPRRLHPESLAYVVYTSGSSGSPKGVAVPHAGLLNLMRWHQRAYGIRPADRATQLAGPAFDAAVWEVWPYLTAGASLRLIGEAAGEVLASPEALRVWLAASDLDLAFLPTPLAEALLAMPAEQLGLRALLTGGDRLRSAAPAGGPRLVNHYGPTENSVVATAGTVAAAAGGATASLPTIGRPIDNVQVFLLDSGLRPVPIGVPGEIHLGGRGLARGYFGRPGLTAEAFIPSPFAGAPGARLYRTGDRARVLADGTLDFLGRLDRQVKIRGVRIELGEIEVALLSHPEVREAVVLLRGSHLAAAFVPRGPEPPDAASLRAFLGARLPDAMVPPVFLPLARLPLTANGKIDRAALESLDWEGLEAATAPGDAVAARTPLEAALAAVWAEVLGLETVGVHDDFFALGGHSLKAARLAARVRDGLGMELPLRSLFAAPTVAGLAALLSGRSAEGAARWNRVARRDGSAGTVPLSFGQQQLWLLKRIDPGSPLFHLPAALDCDGRLDPAALERSLGEILRRHEVLRSRFALAEGSPVQIPSPWEPLELPLIDLSGLPTAVQGDETARRTAAEARHAFDLERGPLLRAVLLRLAPRCHRLLLTLHHIAADASSIALLVRELEQLYAAFVAGGPTPLPDLPLQYADFALWQRERLAEGQLEGDLRYWTAVLGPELPVLELPSDRPRPPEQTYGGARRPFHLPAAETGELRRLAGASGATLFMTVLALLQALLQRHAGMDDVVAGTAVADRPEPRLEELIGYFLNTLVLRGDLAGDPPFLEFLRRARETVLGALAHAALPFERLVAALQPERDLSRSPLFQVFFALTEPLPALALPGLALRPAETHSGATQFDLSFLLNESAGGLDGWIEYNPDLFDATTVERMAGHLVRLLGGAAAADGRRLSELLVLDAAERHQLLTGWNDTAGSPPEAAGVWELFVTQAARTPDAAAVIFRDRRLTYRELARRAEGVGRRLRVLGVAPGDRVGICLDRSPDLPAALFGVLAAGAAYLPLDPALPAPRLAGMLADAQVAALVARRGGKPSPAPCPALLLDGGGEDLAAAGAGGPLPPADPSVPAYLIYTSGSTGRPKGVMVTHGNVLNLFGAMDEALGDGGPGGTGVWLAVTGISFDISVLELLWTLCRGFTVVLQEDLRGAATQANAAATPGSATAARPIDFSLFYFADAGEGEDRYRLLLEGARFADEHGFTAVWTPERHFHPFGGLYPNPAVTGAAVAAVTRRVGIRAGSVVLPLHDPLRVAEEWSVVDNLSRGRVGVSFASGWHADDFVLAPDVYAGRKEALLEGLETVRRLWRGEAVERRGGAGNPVAVRIHPRPVQAELPVWLTAAGNEETFRLAGRLGANLLTHLLGQSLEEVGAKIAAYREARREAGHDPEGGVVTLMLHTFVGEDEEEVRARVRGPLIAYLRSSVGLVDSLARSLGTGLDASHLSARDLEALLDHAFERYYATSALLGTRQGCRRMVERLQAAGVTEIGCLIDFGVEADAVLASLEGLAGLRDDSRRSAADGGDFSLAAQAARHGVTHLQCTPSLAALLVADPASRAALRPLRKLLVGGEALPPPLARQLAQAVDGDVLNMYGPTETTVWSLAARVEESERVTIGRPLCNTGVHLLDGRLQPVPLGAAGEVWLSGDGVAAGYWRRPELTAERFLPDPFGEPAGRRLYRTGDLARRLPDGRLLFLGRADHQVKIRGHRVEPAEVEAALLAHPAVAETVVVAREEAAGDRRLVAYVVPAAGRRAQPSRLEPRGELPAERPRFRMPNGMVITYLSDFQAHTGYEEIFTDEIYLRHGIELPDGACVFDVGANIGLFSLWVHGRCRDPKVFAFEPMPPTFQALRANLALYGLDVRLFNQGMADRPGRADFGFYPNAPGLSGRFAGTADDRAENRAIVRDWLRRVAGPDGGAVSPRELEGILDEQLRAETCSCELVTLSDVIREQGIERIDLLKVDVEKSEVDVLRGIRDEDWGKIDQVVLEVHSRELLEQVSRLLAARGFRFEVEDVAVVDGEGVHVHMLYAVSERRRPAASAAAALLSPGELRRHLAERLPEPMIPTAFVVLEALPRTSNGKLDRRALPAPPERPPVESVYVPPGTLLEQSLAAVWQEVLGRDRIGIHDNFFEVGGSSLLLVQAQARMRQALGREVEVVQMFRHPTIHALAGALARDEDVVDLAEVGTRGRRQAGAAEQSGALRRQRQFLENRKRQKAGRGLPDLVEPS